MLPQKIGRYEIKAELGRGGMSIVYLAHDPHFERDVAIKLLPHELLHHTTFRRRFDREAKIVAALDHPAIVPVYDFGEQDTQPFLVMRFMAGGSLTDRLKQGSLTIHETARILNRLAPALDEVHRRGVVHRDLKPSNILFDQRNEPFISDFGTAKFTFEHTKLTETGGAVGTPAYMSPEQIQAEVEIDGRSDIYTLGIILFEMLTGKHPYQTKTPIGLAVKHIFEPVPRLQDMQPSVPAACQPVVAKVMAKKREDRYQTAVAFTQDLSAVARQLAVTNPSTNPPAEPVSGRRLALLIGASAYEDPLLNTLIKPSADLRRLANALENPHIGCFDEVICLLDEPSNDVRRSLAHFFADKLPDDLLLLYIVGHAALDAAGQLHLTTPDTEHNLLRGTAVSATFIADEMDTCRARQQILIIDCYFSRALPTDQPSGSYLPGIIGKAVDTGSSFTRHGHDRIVITASDETHYIWQRHERSGSPQPSRFTEYFIQALEGSQSNGRKGQPLTIGSLYETVAAKINHNTPDNTQLPRKWFDENQGEIVIAQPAQQPTPPAIAPKRQPQESAANRAAKTRVTASALWRLGAGLAVVLIVLLGSTAASGGNRAAPTFVMLPTATNTPDSPLAVNPTPVLATPTALAAATAVSTPTTPPSPTATATESPATPEPTAVHPATVLLPSSLFAAPDTTAVERAITDPGDTLTILGRSAQGNWLYVLNGEAVTGFIYGDRVLWSGDFATLPVVPAAFEESAPVSTSGDCSGGDCPLLTLDLYPLNGRCEANIRYRTIYMRGQGGDGRYTYYWNGAKVAGPLATGFGFEVNNQASPRIIGLGKVVSGDGQIVEKSLFISEFPCNP
ncbi:MAG: serine/threonine protein kinase [Chloroflexi bacterium]|nr:serine/threonine protein kinase [Chloroflexota bacterium]MBP7043905.1 serine/threonine protein kinase [Chloroflexota bacterium]